MDIYKDEKAKERGRKKHRDSDDESSSDERSRSRSPRQSGRKAKADANEKTRKLYAMDCPGSAEHEALRYQEYRERDGRLTEKQWKAMYANNMLVAKKGGALVEEVASKLPWTKKEIEYPFYVGEALRKVDIADPDNKKAVEVKSGKQVQFSKFTEEQIRKDTHLLNQGWTVTWFFSGECSATLRDELEIAGIAIVEKDLSQIK